MIVRECLDWLKLKGIFSFRVNQIPAPAGKGGFRRFCGTPGVSDIVGILPGHGRFLAIEVKKDVGRQSIAQMAFEDEVHRNGGAYLLVRGSKELESKLSTMGYLS
jgi:hypothetical protein